MAGNEKEERRPLLTVLTPVYKVEAYLRNCIESLLEQDMENYEIILIDDGSPDGSPEICDEYAAAHERISVIHKANSGLSDARNVGIRAARGCYILFVDSDDTVEVNILGKLTAAALRGEADILAGGAKWIRDGVEVKRYQYAAVKSSREAADGVCTGEEFLLNCLPREGLTAAVWLFLWKRSFLIENDLFFRFGILAEDQDFTPRAFLKAKRVAFSKAVHYNYFIREGSITQAKDQSKLLSDLVDTIVRLRAEFAQLPAGEVKDCLNRHLLRLWLYSACGGGVTRKKRKEILRRFDPWSLPSEGRLRLKLRLANLSPSFYRLLGALYLRVSALTGAKWSKEQH